MPKQQKPDPDSPCPFGYKIGWFAVPDTSVNAILRAFGLRKSALASWWDGITAAYRGHVFVTPPVNGWRLLPSWFWVEQLDNNPGRIVAPSLRALSKRLGTAQLFVSYRVPEFHLWAVAKSGRVMRGYCYIGEIMETVWDVGRPSSAELEVGPFDAENWPDEGTVMEVAGRWSVNPCVLDELAVEPGRGLICAPPHAMPTL